MEALSQLALSSHLQEYCLLPANHMPGHFCTVLGASAVKLVTIEQKATVSINI
jgi:hypothetical protein